MAPSRGSSSDLELPTRQVQSLDSHAGPVNVVKYNHGAKYCLTGSSDRTIRLWNPVLGKEIKKYEGHGREVLALDIAHDNAKFASSGGDKLVFVWDVASGTVVRRLQGHFGKINAVAFNADAQVLATAGFDAKIMFWDMRAVSRDPIQTIKDATSSITSLSLPSHPELVSTSLDGHVRAYDLRLGSMTEDLIGDPVYGVALSPTTPRESMLVSTGDGKVRLFDRMTGGVLQTFEGGNMGEGRVGGGRVKWMRGEGGVVAGDEEGKLWAWNVLDAKPIDGWPRQLHKKAITWVEMNPNGKEMLTASADGTVKVWTKGH